MKTLNRIATGEGFYLGNDHYRNLGKLNADGETLCMNLESNITASFPGYISVEPDMEVFTMTLSH